jgi:ribosomal protein L37E
MIVHTPNGTPELACDECGCRHFDRMTNHCYECGAAVPEQAVREYRTALDNFLARQDGAANPAK